MHPFKFVDETSTHLTYCRCCARAEGGQQAHQATLLQGKPNVALVAAMPPNVLQVTMAVRRAVNGGMFAAYLNQVLGDMVVSDNLPAHKLAGLAELVAVHGARLLYLPPYLPDFNPIELAFGKPNVTYLQLHCRKLRRRV